MHLLAVPARVGGHHRLHAGSDRRLIAGRMDVAQILLARKVVALVVALVGAAIAQEVLRRREDVAAPQEIRRAGNALDALHHLEGIFAHDAGILRIAFIGAAPAVVAHDRDGGRERPVLAHDLGLDRGDLADLAQQFVVARRAEADIVRKDRGADDVGIAVDRIRTPDDGDRDVAGRYIHRRGVEFVGGFQPFWRQGTIIAMRAGIAAVENGAEMIRPHIVGRHRSDVGLGDLPDLFLDGHPGENVGDARVEPRIVEHRTPQLRPDIGMNGRNGRCRRRCGRREHRACTECHTCQGKDEHVACDGAGQFILPAGRSKLPVYLVLQSPTAVLRVRSPLTKAGDRISDRAVTALSITFLLI